MGQRLTTVIKEKMWKVKNSVGDVEQMLPETSADQVSIADAAGKYTATDVEGALSEIATSISDLESGLASAGKVDDVRNNASDASTSIVTNKIADLSKAVVKEAGQVGHTLTIENGSHSVDFNGGTNTAVSLNADYFASTTDTASGTNKLVLTLADSGVTAGTYQGLTVDAKGRVTAAEDKGYAVKANVDTELAKKLDKAGGSVTGNLTIGGNLTVNGTTTSIDSTTLKVSDKLIEVAKDNTVKLTTPAGIVVPKYDGTNYGALVIDSDGNAQVGDVKLDASGNIDVTNSDLQTLATREGLTDGNLVKWDDTKKTLVPDTTVASNASSALSKANANATEISTIKTTYQTKTDNTLGTTSKMVVGAINEVKGTADSALSKANANATEISNIKNGTNGTKVKSAEHADNATNVTTSINGKAITDIFETNSPTVKNATHAMSAGSSTVAETANKVKNSLSFAGNTDDGTLKNLAFNGSAQKMVSFKQADFSCTTNNVDLMTYELSTVYTNTEKTQTVAGEYTAIKVDEKGRATAGGKAFAFIEAGAAIPEDVMIGGIVFEAKA